MLIRALTAPDVPAVRQIIEEWLIDPGSEMLLASEVAHRVRQIQEAVATSAEPWFFVAEDAEEILGVIGLQADHVATELHSRAETPVEIVTVYVRRASRGRGVGRALTEAVEQIARQRGFSTLLVVSGSRNRESGYPFWHARYGDPMRVDEDYFGPGAERVVWRCQLRP